MNATHTNPFANANEDISGFDCSTCNDFGTIDHAGQVLRCEHCADYRTAAVTIEDSGTEYIVRDNSLQGPAATYAAGSFAHCQRRANKRKAVIKAAITRRANKAKEI